jgi:hypothetical protein
MYPEADRVRPTKVVVTLQQVQIQVLRQQLKQAEHPGLEQRSSALEPHQKHSELGPPVRNPNPNPN